MTHEEKAAQIFDEWDNEIVVPIPKHEFVARIAKALQDAFDLGFCAAGGSIHKVGWMGDIGGTPYGPSDR